ncbi:MAG: hypothetical protein AB8B63_05300 [Granulosicoccus sp.]
MAALRSDQPYVFTVAAIDSAGQRPTVATATPVDQLAAPTELSSAVYSQTAAELFWARADMPGLLYEIRRDGEIIDTTDEVSFFNAALTSGTTYMYEVIALDGDQRSEASTTSLTTEGS